MAERTYSTTAAPQGYACRIDGVHVPWGATVRINLDALPDWDAAHKWVRRGWLVPVEEEPETAPTTDITDQMGIPPDEWLAAHTVAELRAMCSDRGITYAGMRKAELIDAIMEHD